MELAKIKITRLSYAKLEQDWRYPTTAEIVEYLVENLTLRSSVTALQNKLIHLTRPDSDGFGGWFDDTFWCDEADDIWYAFEQKRLVPLNPNDIPETCIRENAEDVIELVRNHFRKANEIYDILPDPHFPQDGPHCLSGKMKNHLSQLRESLDNIRAKYEKLK